MRIPDEETYFDIEHLLRVVHAAVYKSESITQPGMLFFRWSKYLRVRS